MANSDSNTNDNSRAKLNHAADLVRKKLDRIYKNEPDVEEEVIEVVQQHTSQSKHQKYMNSLTKSGLSLAEIQTSWHNYYVSLPNDEKHQVWQEFYQNHNKYLLSDKTPSPEQLVVEADSNAPRVHNIQSHNTKQNGLRTVSDLKQQLTSKASKSANKRLKAKQHFQSLLFGMSFGLIVVLIMVFSFFNERFIAPFITPSKSVSSTPIIIDSSTTAVGPEPKIIIPKINVEIPVVYDELSLEEKLIQNALERGVLHYGSTPNPGQKGNTVIFGHSSNNILNQGKYKFAFVLLNRLEIGDTFYLNYNQTRYAYKIYEKKIVKPTEVGILGDAAKPSSATLVTCDPPGTSLNRLIVIGEQISPDPNKNTESNTPKSNNEQLKVIPSNAPSLWQRFTSLF